MDDPLTTTGSSLRFVAAAFLTSVAILGAMTFLLVKNGELWTTSTGAKAQFESQGIYGRSIWDDFYAYKFALYDLSPKKYVSVGSSRAMGVRASLFRDQDHLSAGGAVNSIAEAEHFAAEAGKWAVFPRVIFFYADAEWFIAGSGRRRHVAARQPYESVLFLYQSAFVHLQQLAKYAFVPRLQVDPSTGGLLIGSRAQRLQEGFRVDGSVRHNSYINARGPWPAAEFQSYLSAVDSDAAVEDAGRLAALRGWAGAKVDPERLLRFEKVLESLKARGASVVLILAPVAPHLARALKTQSDFAFYPAAADRLAALAHKMAVPFFDFTSLGLPYVSCYYDYYHGSEGAYAWMLSKMQRRLADAGHSAAEAFDPNALHLFAQAPCLKSLPERGRVEAVTAIPK
jgi:hypothetical protein